MVDIVPTLFATTPDQFRDRVAVIEKSARFRYGWLQLDIMDGVFVPTKSVSFDVIRNHPLAGYEKEAHLMVADPAAWIEQLVAYGVSRIIFPIEIDKDPDRILRTIKRHGITVGLSINPDTDARRLSPYAGGFDAVLCMGATPGREGQILAQTTVVKVAAIKKRFPGVKVGVDGGVNETNAGRLVAAGADYLAVGSFLFTGDFDANFDRLQEAIGRL